MTLSAHTTTDADHGRIEERRHSVCHNTQWLLSDRRYPDEPHFPHLAMLAMVDNHVEREGRKTTARDYYLSSVKLDAQSTETHIVMNDRHTTCTSTWSPYH